MDEPVYSAPWSARLPRMNPVRAFAAVFMAVFLLIFMGAAVVTFMMPKTYAAKAQVIAPDKAAVEWLVSAAVLEEVSQRLRLPEKLAARYGEDQPLAPERVEDLLRRSLHVRRVRKTDVVEILAFDRSPADSAQLANEVAATAARLSRQGSVPIRVIDRASPPLRPARPNKPLNLVLGAVVGAFLGTLAGGVGAKLAVGFDGERPANA